MRMLYDGNLEAADVRGFVSAQSLSENPACNAYTNI